MKLSTVLPALALLAPTLATPIEQRDIAAIKDVLTNINTQVTALDGAITAKPIDPASIVSKADGLADTIRKGTTNVNSQDKLNDIDALGLVSPTQKLADNTESTVQDLIDIKSNMDSMGKSCTSLKSLQELNSAAQDLSGAIVSKVPQSLNDIASNLSNKISSAIQEGVDAYQGSCDQKEAPKEAEATQEAAPKVPKGACKA